MYEWKTIPANTRVCPNLATWRRSDIDDTLTDYICKGRLIREDNTVINCIIGYCASIDAFGDDCIFPKYYKEV